MFLVRTKTSSPHVLSARFRYVPRDMLVGLISAYQILIRPFLGPRCRFYPSCSAYAAEALRRFGVLRGTALALKRVVRCHPLNEGGVDRVPTGYSEVDRDG